MRLIYLLVLSLLVASLKAASVEDLTFSLNILGTEYVVTGCDYAASGTLDIPSTFGGLPVTTIRGEAFRGCTSLTSITIPDSVTSIGTAAFLFCTGLTSFTIPGSVTSIGIRAFEHCSRLTSINILNGVNSIGELAFRGCTSLSNITIPDSVNSIGDRAFEDCYSLTSITIGDSVTSIGNGAFNGCTELNDINLPYRFFYLDWEDIGLTSASNPIVPQLVLDEARLSMIANYLVRSGIEGLQGPAGETGLQGPQGEKGDKGDTGPQGPAGFDSTAIKTLKASEPYVEVNKDGTFNLEYTIQSSDDLNTWINEEVINATINTEDTDKHFLRLSVD